MRLFVCSKILNTIKNINLHDYSLNEIVIDPSKKTIGFSCITKYKDYLILGSEYSSYMYSIDISHKNNIEKIFIGASVSKVISYDEKVLLLCSDINALLVYDMKEKKIIVEIPIGNYPFSIDIDEKKNLIYVSSFLENCITIIDIKEFREIMKIRNIEHPTKVFCDNNKIYVLESRCENFERGFLEIIYIDEFYNYKTLGKFEVGRMPIDMIIKDDDIYVISIMDENINKISKISNINSIKCDTFKNVALMPTQILNYRDDIFILDSYAGFIKKIDFEGKKIINIAKVQEPSAMFIV